jgi:hypothetical protein
LEQDPLWIEQELAGIVSTLRAEQEPVEISPERAESLLRRFWPVGVFLGIGAAFRTPGPPGVTPIRNNAWAVVSDGSIIVVMTDAEVQRGPQDAE